MRALIIGLALVTLANVGSIAQPSPRPNVVMIIMDDLGYGDLGSYGAPDAKTPNIDRLAREGVKFTDFYANHANCSPTRTGFITGRYQQRYGIESPLRAIDDARQLLPSDTSLPRLLKRAGYATGLMGKWHLGARAEAGPNRHGFDEFWGFRGGAVDYYTHDVVTTPTVKLPAPIHDLYHNEEPAKASGYLTDEITTRSEAFIQQHRAAPFFLEVAYNATHWPFQGPDLPEGKRGRVNSLESGTRADYIAMLERADQGVGKILGLLDRLNLAANTLVIFTSDNGGEWLSRNAPLFHRKSTLWEGGIRVPLLMRWPARLAPGITPQAGITMDLTASILAAAAIAPPESYRPEGIDLIGPLQKRTIVERTLFWRLPAPPNAPGPAVQRAVRRGNWKYLQDRGQNFLFDLLADPSEQRDVAQSHIAIWQELRGLADRWEADVNAEARQLATPAPAGQNPPTSTGPASGDGQMQLGNFSVSLAVKDIAASRAFYEKLGFRQIAGDQSQNWLILQNSTSTIGLFQGPQYTRNMLTFNPGWDRTGSTLQHFDDVRDIQRTLKSRGIVPTAAADESSTGPASMVLTDPDGNPVLIDQHVPKPPK